MSDYLTFEQIVQSDDLVEADVECPEWGGKVRVRGLSVKEATTVTAGLSDDKAQRTPEQLSTTNLKMVIMGCVNPKLDANAIEVLSKKAMAPVFRIISKIQELSGISEAGALTKN